MDTYYLDSPLGTIKVRGDAAGIQEVCFVEACVNETTTVPDHLVSCVKQLQQYFEGKRQQFDFNINPQGTVFQKKIWGLLASLPFGRTLSYIEGCSFTREHKSCSCRCCCHWKKSYLSCYSLPSCYWK